MSIYIDVRRFDEMAARPFNRMAIQAPWPWGARAKAVIQERITKAAAGMVATKYKKGDVQDVPIQVFCASGFRSESAAATLKGWKYTNVTNGGGVASMNQRLAAEAAHIVTSDDDEPGIRQKAVSEQLHEGFPVLNTSRQFAQARSFARKHLAQLKGELTEADYDKDFLLVCNTPEADEAYLDPTQVGKSSIGGGSAHTRLISAVAKLKKMQQAANQFTSTTKEEWSTVDNVGLFFHVYGLNSVNALHLHIIDGAATGPTYEACQHKNLPLSAALEVFQAELKVLRKNIASGKGKATKVGGDRDVVEDERLAQVLAVLDDNAKEGNTPNSSSVSNTPPTASNRRICSSDKEDLHHDLQLKSTT
eukprot:gene9061-12886_t